MFESSNTPGEQASLAASTPHAPERDGQTSGLRGFGRVADGKPKRFCRLTWRSSVEAAFHAELTTAPPGLFSTVEHVGSTSVPGLAAKPIIDLMAATDDLDAVAAREGDLRLLGYGFHVAGTPGRLLYRRGPANARTHHLHVVQASTLPTPNQVLLRDNGDDYTRAKTELIQELTDKARAERGLPPTGVGEE